MLIDSSYFIGEINIPNSLLSDVASRINNLIQRHETEILRKAMGYELFKAFSDGLLQPTVDQKWLDILFGKEYTDSFGRLNKWNGLITTNNSTMVISAGEIQPIFFTVGGVGAPAVGDGSYINSALAGKIYTVNQRGFGKLQPGTDITIRLTGGFDWLGGNTFAANQVFDISFSGVVIDVVAGGYQVIPDKRSPIADYVYYWWQRGNRTFTSGQGEVANTTPVVHKATVGLKPAEAYNRFVDEMWVLNDFLRLNNAAYPEYRSGCAFVKINNFNIGVSSW